MTQGYHSCLEPTQQQNFGSHVTTLLTESMEIHSEESDTSNCQQRATLREIMGNERRQVGPTIADLMKAIDQRRGEQWAVQNIHTTLKINEIIRDIGQGTAVAISDGSFKDEAGTAAWIIENESGTQRMMGYVMVPGFASDQSAYRSEIAGIYGSVLVVEMIKEVWGITQGGILIGCDGKDALKQAVDTNEVCTSCKQQHFDLLSGIQGYIRGSCLKYTSCHIKGHQDETKSWEDLDRLAMLNVEVDLAAKEFWTEKYNDNDKKRRYFSYMVPKGMWQISFFGY